MKVKSFPKSPNIYPSLSFIPNGSIAVFSFSITFPLFSQTIDFLFISYILYRICRDIHLTNTNA